MGSCSTLVNIRLNIHIYLLAQSHNFLKDEYEEVPEGTKSTAPVEKTQEKTDEETDVEIPMVQSADATGQSRLTNEFEVTVAP